MYAATTVFRLNDSDSRLQRVEVAHTAFVSHVGLDSDIAIGHFFGLIVVENASVGIGVFVRDFPFLGNGLASENQSENNYGQ